jgi:hypothetical protein
LTMLNSLVGWVGSTKSGLLAIDLVGLPDYVRIAKYLNPTPNLTLLSQTTGWTFQSSF